MIWDLQMCLKRVFGHSFVECMRQKGYAGFGLKVLRFIVR